MPPCTLKGSFKNCSNVSLIHVQNDKKRKNVNGKLVFLLHVQNDNKMKKEKVCELKMESSPGVSVILGTARHHLHLAA